jgi:hypothetical protein
MYLKGLIKEYITIVKQFFELIIYHENEFKRNVRKYIYSDLLKSSALIYGKSICKYDTVTLTLIL